MSEKIVHMVLSVLVAAFVVITPCAVFLNIFNNTPPDAVSQATMTLPDQPSGNFVVFINSSLHKDTIDDWKSFFNDEYAVIFDDISCITASGDISGRQLAERFKAQLPQNQMSVRSEDAVLLASKLDAGLVDVAVFSKEMADALNIKSVHEGIMLINITEDESSAKN